jgi:hypothetical protein
MEIFNLGVPNMAERHPKIKYTQIRFKSRKNINNKGNKKYKNTNNKDMSHFQRKN